MNIGDFELGNKVFIIAELSANHNGSLDNAINTIRAAKRAGANCIKLQTYTPDTLTIDSNKSDFIIKSDSIWDGLNYYELYKKAYTPWKWHSTLFEEAKKQGLICFSSPFDKTAVDFLETLNVPAYKIASFEITDIPLIEYVASKGKPIIISTGIANIEDIELAIKACVKKENSNIILLKCTSSYPAPIEESNICMIRDLAERFNVISGLSDHTLGSTVPILAVAFGARCPRIPASKSIIDLPNAIGSSAICFIVDASSITSGIKLNRALGTSKSSPSSTSFVVETMSSTPFISGFSTLFQTLPNIPFILSLSYFVLLAYPSSR